MLNTLLHRSIAAVNHRLVLVTPADASIPGSFENVEVDPIRRRGVVTVAESSC
jgi:hypothetical protein